MGGRACASCGTSNEEDARFCEGCGTTLDRMCGTCGAQASATARFCRSCGAPVDDRAAVPESPTRKTVTVLFADLAGSTSFEEQVDAETARDVIGRYHDLLRSTAAGHRAGVTKYIGDGFMAVWGVPETGVDDAGQAVDAAVELQERFVDLAAQVADAHGVDLALRVAVNTGEVVVGAGDADLVGDALNVGARLESECPHGHVVVGEETWRSTRGRHRYEPLGRVQVKGRSTPVPVYQWLGGRSETADSVPFVGRADELRRLQKVFDDAVAARTARLVTVLGDPGVGKSRLAAEFTGAQRGARVIQTYCAAEGTVALAPIVEVLRTRDLDADVPAGVPERDRILRDLKGMTEGVAGSVEETFWALRRFVEVLASEGPLVIVLDDIQWADTLLLDFIEHLAEWVRDVPVLMVALARRELREVRPDLVTVGGWVTEALRLDGLGPGATAELAAHVLGSDRLPAELLGRLPSSTGGNPLFVRELVGMLVHDGVLVPQPDGWHLTIDVDAIAVPPTIQALLSSRLERMNTTDRRVLEIASVIGTDFLPGVVCELGGMATVEVKNSLERLRRRELAQPSGAYIGDEPVWRFHHVLIRDVAYRRLLKSDRADLHERLADWESGGAGGSFESDELVARHLEAAHGYRCDLGARDGRTPDLALRAARSYLASAGRALDRDELVSAGTQAARGAALAAADQDLHAELLLVGCEAFLSAGDVAAGAPLVDDLERIADDALAPWATCYRCQFVVYTDPTRLLEVDARLHDAIEEFGRRGDPAGLARAHRVRAGARGRLGRIGDCEVDLFEALIAARQGGDHRQITAALGAAPNAALWGPSPVPKAGGRCLDVVRMQRMTTAAPSLEATSLRCLAVLELLRGRPDKARSMLADARQIVADLGLRHGLMETELYTGIVELMVGDPVAAEPHFRTALEGLDALGVGADAGQAAALLARSVLAQGRIDEADRYAAESERIAGHNLKTAIAWRAVRAEIHSAQGRHDEAVALARDAVAVAAGTDLVLDHADACFALSRVLAAADDERGAANARHNAESLYAAKDAVITAGRTAETVAAPTGTPPPDAAKTSRLTTVNRAYEILESFWRGMQPNYSDSFVYDDRRRLSGEPIIGGDEFQAARVRKFEQYPHAEARTLAVRGETLILIALHWSDDTGNETTSLDLFEVDDDALMSYHGRFDEDDFEDAYRELELRYHANEGASFANSGMQSIAVVVAMNRGDFDAVFNELSQPDLRFQSRSHSVFPDRSAAELRASFEELYSMVSSVQSRFSAVRWMSPTLMVGRLDREAVGRDGEQYTWTRILVNQYRDGLFASTCEFERDDEDQAFAYAQTLVAPRPSRLAVSNRASEINHAVSQGFLDHDPDALVANYSDGFVYDDRRRLHGDPIVGKDELRTAGARLIEQYPHCEWQPLAVRGETLALVWARRWDDAGNESESFDVLEVGDTLIDYHGRFDEDDFESAYRELERRYYEGEGAPFAPCGLASAEWVAAIGRRDVEAARRVSQPDFRWLAPPAALKAGERSVDDMFAWMQERGRQVSSQRYWVPVLQWLSPRCSVGLGEIWALGVDGEEYQWNFLFVGDCRDGSLASVREFDIDDEEAAFAYAETLIAQQQSRMAVTNRASEVGHGVLAALQAHDVDGTIGYWSDGFVYEDQRRFSGDPVENFADLRANVERICQQYNHFDGHTLAVRGERLHLMRSRWSDDDGNQTTYLHVIEVGDYGRITCEGRFDDDDFEGAYRELENRYYAGEGAEFAEAGATLSDVIIADNHGELGRVLGEVLVPGMHFESRSRSMFPTRTTAELVDSVEELSAMVASSRVWFSAVCWVSRNWVVLRHEREGVGPDDEKYEWTRLYVIEFRYGLVASVCEFDVNDEEQAFAYAEERMRASASRLAVTNRASEVGDGVIRALRARDIDAAVGAYADQVMYDDRRRWWGGDPIHDRAGVRAAFEHICEQHSRFEGSMLAVRGERLYLAHYRWSDDAGNQTSGIALAEINNDGRITYDGRFDEDDVGSAYRELERRYFAGEGSEFAANGRKMDSFLEAMDALDVEAAQRVCLPAFRWFTPPSTLTTQERSLDEFFQWLQERAGQVSSVKNFGSVVRWLSPTCLIALGDVQAIGSDGEEYRWTRLYVGEFRDGLLASMREFDLDDEEGAFAYAEDRIRASASRLAVTNRASEAFYGQARDLQTRDIDSAVGRLSDQFVYDDRRRLSGDSIHGRAELRAAAERICGQYSAFEARTLAVRGELVGLFWSRWSDDAGNESTHLHVWELVADGRLLYEARFDEDDFESAYQELEQRYYAGEGAPFAESGMHTAEYVTAMNRGDFDILFDQLSSPDLHVENRSRSGFPDRSAAQLRTSLEELQAMLGSVQAWFSSVRWLSPTLFVGHLDREGLGRDGERYAWSRILVCTYDDGRLASICDFEGEDEAAAFAYAEEQLGGTGHD